MGAIFVLLTFNFYIRMIMESFIFMGLSILIEIKAFNTKSGVTIFSLGLSFLFLASIMIFFVSAVCLYFYSTKRKDLKEKWMFKELFSGVKDDRLARTHSVMFMLIRFLSVVIVVTMRDAPYLLKSGLFSMIHLVCMVYYIAVRPFDNVKDNITETINQTTYFVMVTCLCFLREKENWSSSYETMYMYLFLGSPAIGVMIQFLALLNGLR